MSNPVLDALMGGTSCPAAEFRTVGTTVGGKIVAPPQVRQTRAFDRANPGKGELQFWPDGRPIMGVTIDVKAFASEGDDSGVRRLYADARRAKEALKDALIKADAMEQGFEVGGYLLMTYTGDEMGEGTIPAKTWKAIYRTPDQQAAYAVVQPAQPETVAPPAYVPPAPDPQLAAFQAWQAQQAAAQPAPAPVAAPPAAPVAPPASTKPQINAQQAAAMANAGVDISQFQIVG